MAQLAGQHAQAGWARARAFEQEHAVGEKVASAAQATLGKAQQLDAEYKIGEHAGAAARAVGQAASSGLDALLGWVHGGDKRQ